MEKRGGYFVISLDFELHWGMFDKVSLEEYGDAYKGVRVAVPELLEFFTEHNVHATWATVGMLMCRHKNELFSVAPKEALHPEYIDYRLSAYHHLKTTKVGADEREDFYHFGASLVEDIVATPGQELGSHTFSHFYAKRCRKGAVAAFAADCESQIDIAASYGTMPTSLVFPRNQATDETLMVAHEHGITAYRGNENHILYRGGTESSLPIRGFRLLDAYFNLSGHHTYPATSIAVNRDSDTPANIPSSRFLRPYEPRFRRFESWRLRRIKNSMTHAAKHGEVFHLWWHPHNFGRHRKENMENLKELIAHFESLRESHGMESKNMAELAALARPVNE